MRTRLQARPVQSTDLVTLPRAQPPGGLENFWQASAGVSDYKEEEGPSVSFAERNFLNSRYTMSKCKDKRCKICPRLSTDKIFYSSITGKTHIIINPLNVNISCKASNLIYLLTCENCGLQYVGETALTLNK